MIPWLILQSHQCDRGRLDVRCERHPVDDFVPGIPPSAYTSPIEQHLNTGYDSPTRGFRSVARRKLLEGDDGERRRDDPAVGAGNPGPAKLVRIDARLLVCKLEFPTP
jgi:hypothetical protein